MLSNRPLLCVLLNFESEDRHVATEIRRDSFLSIELNRCGM